MVGGELAGAEGHDSERGDGEDELQDAEAEAPYRAGRPPEGRGPILWHPCKKHKEKGVVILRKNWF